jgi:general stress protein 26
MESVMAEASTGSKDRLIHLLRKVRIAMLSTKGPDGRFHSRPMATSDVEFDGSLYFLTDDRSGKVGDLSKDPETLVTFSDETKQIYLALRGRAEVIRDRNAVKAHWTAAARGWFPEGTDDPDVALIRFHIEDAEYWDAPNGKMVVLYAYAKAVLTGEKPGNVGEHARVSLS